MTIFFISDHHFGHQNMLKFTREDGSPVRPEFNNVDDMDREMVRRHNSVVGPNDKVYFLGDVALKAKDMHRYLPQMQGKKTLVLGNHDRFRMDEYYKHFDRIYSGRILGELDPKLFLCHYPLLLGKTEKAKVCVHGHIHYKSIDDPRYFNVSVERLNYTPISVDELLLHFKVALATLT